MTSRIIVVDDEKDFLDSVRRGLIMSGYKDLTLTPDPLHAVALLESGECFDVAILDITMPDMDGMELLQKFQTLSPATECIMVTAINEVRVAVECMQKGACDYLVKPILREDLILRLQRALEKRRLMEILELRSRPTLPRLSNEEAFRDIRTASTAIMKILKEAELHAASDVPVLITGESGTGKELLARAIHRASPRAAHPFTAINMASMSETLFDAEFFGHTRGAFTGAEKERAGYLERTHQGTLFLDEIANLPPGLQGKLLRVLQEGEFMKLGSSNSRRIDIRFIAATNQDLERLLSKGSFRKDLYFRLRGAWLHVPPLRERREDIPVLVDGFLRELGKEPGSQSVEPDAMSLLMEYDYPGNIRELRSIIQATVNLVQPRPISSKSLPSYVQKHRKSTKNPPETGGHASVLLAEVEKAHILRVYEGTGENKAQTAKLLDIGLSTLRRKLESYGLE